VGALFEPSTCLHSEPVARMGAATCGTTANSPGYRSLIQATLAQGRRFHGVPVGAPATRSLGEARRPYPRHCERQRSNRSLAGRKCPSREVWASGCSQQSDEAFHAWCGDLDGFAGPGARSSPDVLACNDGSASISGHGHRIRCCRVIWSNIGAQSPGVRSIW
jgi:hypothetical protein